jgi:myosin heavy subunit
MDDLHPLNEASILANIEFRFRIDNIYTRTGPILIAMNPFKVSRGTTVTLRPCQVYAPERAVQGSAKCPGLHF